MQVLLWVGRAPAPSARTQAVANSAGSFFYKHPLLAKYEWYWRLEPEIKYFCDIT